MEAKVSEVTKYSDKDRLITVDEPDEEQLRASVHATLNGSLHQ